MKKPHLLQGKTVNRNVSLPENLDRALQDQAIREDRPVSRVVRRALVEYLDHRESPPNDRPE